MCYNFRNDFSIEIWNLSKLPFLERTIPGNIESSVEAICWVGERLFSVGLSGDGIKEYDLKTLAIKRKILLTGESGICMDYNEKKGLIAVGTEEGILNIFDVKFDDLQFHRLLDRQDHRITCCKFDDNGDKLVSGSIDAVKIWNVQTGQVISKMSLGRADPNQSTIVWCIEMLNDFTFVTGDSRGKVIIWDGNLGSQIDYVHPSSVDIMCITVSEDRNSFFCSGVEQILRKFTKVTTKRAGSEVEQWVKSMKRSKLHSHDVIAMTVVCDDYIVSGGIDGFLTISSPDLKTFERFGPFLAQPFASSAEKCRLILMRYVNYLELWRLANPGELATENNDDSDEKLFDDDVDVLKNLTKQMKTSEIYEMTRHPEKLIEMHSKNHENIICSAISNDGNWIAYSTPSVCRLFCLKVQDNEKPILKLMKTSPEEFTACNQLIFSKDSQTLLSVKSDSTFSFFKLYSDGFEHKETIDVSEHHSDLIHMVELSDCTKFLSLASLDNVITVWNIQRNKWNVIKTLPKYSYPVTSMKIDSNHAKLVVAFADDKILELNLDTCLMDFSANIIENSGIIGHPIQSICLDPRREDALIFQKGDSIHVLTKETEKVTKKKSKSESKRDIAFEVKVVKKYNSVSKLIKH